MRSSIDKNPDTARYCKYNVEKLQDTVLIRENTDQRNPTFWHILRSAYLYKHENLQTGKTSYYYVIYEISDK